MQRRLTRRSTSATVRLPESGLLQDLETFFAMTAPLFLVAGWREVAALGFVLALACWLPGPLRRLRAAVRPSSRGRHARR